MKTTLDMNNFLEIRKMGLQALENALGPVGMTRFIQQYENGYEDYTKEKYQQPDLTVEEIAKGLMNNY